MTHIFAVVKHSSHRYMFLRFVNCFLRLCTGSYSVAFSVKIWSLYTLQLSPCPRLRFVRTDVVVNFQLFSKMMDLDEFGPDWLKYCHELMSSVANYRLA
ncbi:hypothetical protein VNO77_45180 [Canavalia gladiata]|uniref:Uncharacterized protein n=1 Tax=Canavalia gladiata TaxID=3824 RepID=A0AAN9JUS6_CANGL